LVRLESLAYCKKLANSALLDFCRRMNLSPIVAAFVLWLLAACDGLARLVVLTSFAPIHSLTLNVAGDAADVSVLIPPNTGPHDYSFSPSDIGKIAHADVLIVNGAGLESWLAKGIKSAAGKDLQVVDTSRGIDLIISPEARKLAGAKPEHEADAGGPNPHIWLSPRNAIIQVNNIRDALVSRDPENDQVYKKNADAYIQRLTALDEDIRTATGSIANKTLITFHDTFPYFARDYGFTIAATFEEFPGKEPSPKAIKQLRETIETAHAAALFSEPQYSAKAMQVFAQEFKIPVIMLDPMETGDGQKDFYERVMRKNLESLAAAFHGER
jgi:zinc transport system substrate-binding protein